MANKYIQFPYTWTGRTIVFKCQQFDENGNPTGKWLDDADGDFRASPGDDTIPMSESGIVSGLYYKSEGRKTWDDGIYRFYFIDDAESFLVGHAESLVYYDAEWLWIAGNMAAIADAVWDEAKGDHTAAGSTGKALNDIESEVGTILGRVDQTISVTESNIRGADSDTLKSLSDQIDAIPNSSDVADAVWDEAASGHVTGGTFGDKLQNKIPSANVNDYKADVSNLDVAVSTRASASVCTESRLSELDSGNIPADIDTLLTRLSATRASNLDYLDQSISSLDALIDRVVGIVGENQYIDQYSYIDGKMVSARMRIYTAAGSVGTDNDVLATYNITATYGISGTATLKIVKA